MARNLHGTGGVVRTETHTTTKPKREPLSQERIAKTSLELIDQIGLDEFSTRRLGAALGCEAMAIYNHFASKDELLDAVADRLMSKAEIPDAGDWVARARGLARSYRALARIHPNAFPLLATRRQSMPSAFKLYDAAFAIAIAEGLDPFTVACMFRSLAQFCTGTALYEITSTAYYAQHGANAEPPPGFAEAYPHLAAVSAYFTPGHFDEVFQFGLEVLLDGFRRAVPPKA